MRTDHGSFENLFAEEADPVRTAADRDRRPRRVLPLLRHALGTGRGALIAWALAIVAVTSLYLPLYPSIGSSAQLQDLIDGLPTQLVQALGFDEIATGAGYTQATVLGLVGFLLLTIASIAWGAGVIASDEERGTLELTLAHGVSRSQLYIERTLAVLIKLAILALVTGGMIALYNEVVDLGISPIGIAMAVLSLYTLAVLSGSFAIMAGAISGRRGSAIVLGAAIAVIGYVLTAVGNQSRDLAFLGDYSPYSWAFGHEPLRTGWDVSTYGVIGLALAALLLGLLVFSRRDAGR